ncbi:GNAT family N-acetyltransferase [Weissella soli]|uniref:GNAT family N-acetyltransferase n=1 Tax=Weissella soli TaxID=155866 RepID=UPI00359FF5DF
MDKEITTRQANTADITRILEIVAGARQKMHAQGNPQWGQAYPGRVDFLTDIERHQGYVIELDGEVVGVYALVAGPDINYDKIEGAWLPASDGQYFAIHRIAVDVHKQGLGLATHTMHLIEAMVQTISGHEMRIDTHEVNVPMQKVIKKAGFTYNGIVYMVADGTPRLAYSKSLL